jgi:hypothetical protein
MRLPRTLPLDLANCVLEDRVLMAYGPGLLGNAFFAYNPFSNQLIVPNTGGGSGPGGGSSNPGPTFYNLLVGQTVSSGSAGSSSLGPGSGGTISLFSMNVVPSTSLGAGSSTITGRTGNTATSGGGGDGTGRAGAAGGFSSQFSSGFGFALGSANNFGVGAVTVGSVPVHTYGGGGDPVVEPTDPANQTDPNAMPKELQPPADAPMSGPINTTAKGVDVNPRNNLLGRSPATMGSGR